MAPPADLEIRTPTATERDAVVRVLSDAFADDPVFAWMYPDPEVRRRVLPPFFALFAEQSAAHGGDLVAGDGHGAALWVPPGTPVIDPEQEDAFGRAVLDLSPPDRQRVIEGNVAFDAHHPREPHWYLSFLGVASAHRGEGIGSALLRDAVRRCDATAAPAYLESTSADNRRLYERHGFEVTAEIVLPGGPTCFAMWRAARTGPA